MCLTLSIFVQIRPVSSAFNQTYLNRVQIDTVHTKVQNLGFHYCKKQNPKAVECTPGKQRTWFGFETKRTLNNRLEKFANGEARRRTGIKRGKRDV